MPRLTSFKVIFFFLILAVVDHSVLPAIRIGQAFPSFLYLFVCYAAVEWETRKTLPVAFWAGFLKDLFGGGYLGVMTGVLVLVAAALDQVVRRIERQFPGIYFLIVFAFVFMCEALQWGLTVLTGNWTGEVGGHFGGILGMAVYTAVFFPVFDALANLWFGKHPALKQYELFK